eukprot:gene4529-20781_t
MAQLQLGRAFSNQDFVAQLLAKSFGARSAIEQKNIAGQEKPMPKLELKTQGRVFEDDWYEKNNGCVVVKASRLRRLEVERHNETVRQNRGILKIISGAALFVDIQNDLIECIDSIIQDQIDKEVENFTFISLQLDETTNVSTK